MWSRKSSSEGKFPRLSSLRTRILSQISTCFIQEAWMARVIQHDLGRRVMQKGGATFHRLENAAFAFDQERLWGDPFPLSNPARPVTLIDEC